MSRIPGIAQSLHVAWLAVCETATGNGQGGCVQRHYPYTQRLCCEGEDRDRHGKLVLGFNVTSTTHGHHRTTRETDHPVHTHARTHEHTHARAHTHTQATRILQTAACINLLDSKNVNVVKRKRKLSQREKGTYEAYFCSKYTDKQQSIVWSNRKTTKDNMKQLKDKVWYEATEK